MMVDEFQECRIIFLFQIITQITSWKGGYVAVNNFGIGGSNAHLLLKSNTEKSRGIRFDNVPRLVTISGRTKEAVQHILTYVICYFDITNNGREL